MTASFEKPKEQDNIVMGSERSFGLVFAAVFAIIGLWPTFTLRTLPALHLGAARLWALALAAAFLALAYAAPAVLKPLNRLWFLFGLLLARVMNPIIMGVLFGLVFVPFGIAMRLLGRDLLRLKIDRQARSYWLRRDPPGPTGDSMRNQF